MTNPLRKALRLLTAPILLAVPCLAQAWTVDEWPRTVTQIGSHTGPVGFLLIAEGLPATCQNGVLYFDLSAPLGKAMYATLTLAKVTGQKVRLAYAPPASVGLCYLELVSMQ